ncbi:MAG: riboflavin synthase [Candidatus Altiarchaeota archaeon]
MRIGVVDTTFARADMGKIVVNEIRDSFGDIVVVRRTVPGVKDLPVECLNLLSECDIVVACGMPGAQEMDKVCAHEASTGLIQAQLMTGKHIIEAFVHEDEETEDRGLKTLVEDRCRKHARNAVMLLKDPAWFTRNAGRGMRQGRDDAGSLYL